MKPALNLFIAYPLSTRLETRSNYFLIFIVYAPNYPGISLSAKSCRVSKGRNVFTNFLRVV